MNLQIIIDFIFGNSYGQTTPTIIDVLSENVIFVVIHCIGLIACFAGLYGIGAKIFGKDKAYKAIIPFYGLWQLFYHVGLNSYLSIFAWVPVIGLIPRGIFHFYVARAFGEKEMQNKILVVVAPFIVLNMYGWDAKYEFMNVRGKGAAFKNSFQTIMPGTAGSAEASHVTQAGIKYQETADEMRARKDAEAAEAAKKKHEEEEEAKRKKAAEQKGTVVADLFSSADHKDPTTDIQLPISADGKFSEADQVAEATAAIAAREQAAREAAEAEERRRQAEAAAEAARAEEEARRKQEMEAAAAAAAEKARKDAEAKAAAEARAKEEEAARAREEMLRRMQYIAQQEKPKMPEGEPISMVSPVTKAFTEPDSPEIENLEDVAGLNDLPGAIRATEHGDEPANGINVETIAPLDNPVPTAPAVDAGNPVEAIGGTEPASVAEPIAGPAPVSEPVSAAPVEPVLPVTEPAAEPVLPVTPASVPKTSTPEPAIQEPALAPEPAAQEPTPTQPEQPAENITAPQPFRGIEQQIPEPIENPSQYIQTAENIQIPKTNL